jgi:hypothetical protein
MDCTHSSGECLGRAGGLYTADAIGSATLSVIALCEAHARQSPDLRIVQRIPGLRPSPGD